ncbi:DNA GyrAse a-subunit [Plasmodium cynomolgi strain B]|uniref:DNA topoisomerase (ATP-hydrolyzing) n=1 Tax=Plasmodium cynomolgi (strain B) TaxID=1120755 RepID=K6VI82_PLACD|nr:DNA GyrAse a-subunit [Plasmodium cynomolgi strain B]GAB69062.1 DNA GyrAse a-subunit [Plasmodium cynomolgi strain B]
MTLNVLKAHLARLLLFYGHSSVSEKREKLVPIWTPPKSSSAPLFIHNGHAGVRKGALRGRSVLAGHGKSSRGKSGPGENGAREHGAGEHGAGKSGATFLRPSLLLARKGSAEGEPAGEAASSGGVPAGEAVSSGGVPTSTVSNDPSEEPPTRVPKTKRTSPAGGAKTTGISDPVDESIKRIKGEYYDVEICELLSKSFLSYANFLILNRCLCDYRDGLKTVQRRIIWSMYEINKGAEKGSYKKCARIVGEVIGKYHPHGDKSVYDALVRLAQKHHNSNLLINGYGNFGSVEYNAAAMRYTEAKISNFCYDILLEEINDANVEYVRNFDGNELEPKVFCSKIPLLLINGCSGIAVSILSNIPCHNLVDVINCTISFLLDPNIKEDHLAAIIKGPDFSTGGIIISKQDELQNVYQTGKGNIEIRSNVFLEYTKNDKIYVNHVNDLANLHSEDVDPRGSKKLVIKNLPPNVKPNELIENMINILNEKKNEHENILQKIRDESEKEDMRIVLELRKNSQVEQINDFVSFIFKHTQMQVTYHCNFVCIGHENSYTQFSLKSFLQLWCENRIKFIRNNLTIKNQNLLKELHIIDLYILIQKKILEIISFLQKNQNIEEIKKFFKKNFQLNDYQIQHILSMKIQKLVNIKNVDFATHKEKILTRMQENRDLIANVDKIKRLIIDQLAYIKNKYGTSSVGRFAPPQSVKYRYVYINPPTRSHHFKEDFISPPTPQRDDLSKLGGDEENSKEESLNLQSDADPGELHNGEEQHTAVVDPTLPKGKNQRGGVHDVEGFPPLEGTQKEAKRIDPSVQYRHTYIDSIHTDVKDVYNNDHVLVLITYGGYVKKIKIAEKLKNHQNNIIKLSNVKYILKENEERRLKVGGAHEEAPNVAGSGAVNVAGSGAVNVAGIGEANVAVSGAVNVAVSGEATSNAKPTTANSTNCYKVKKSILCRNKDKLLLTDSQNKAYILNVCDLQTSSYDSKGTPINQIIHCSKSITGMTKFEENKKYLIVCSENGKMKVINNDVFLKKKKKGIRLFKNKKDIHFSYCNFSDNCIVGTASGHIIQFPLINFKISKKNSLGNKCINLGKNDKVVDLLAYENDEKSVKNFQIIFLSKGGHGKMINLEELKVQKKKGKGYKIMKFKRAKGATALRGEQGEVGNGEDVGKEDDMRKGEDMRKAEDAGKESQAPSPHMSKRNTDQTSAHSTDPDEFLGFKLYDMTKKNDNDFLIMITDHAVLIRKNITLLKKKNRKHSSQIYAKLSKLNRLVYFDIM